MFSGIDISAFGGSQIAPATIEAYLATEYRAWGDWPLVLRIGQESHPLASLYRQEDAKGAAMLTAWNPFSEPREVAENDAAQLRLIGELDRLGFAHQPGNGADPTGQWPPEDSRLVLGISLEIAASLGRQFRQNGIVWVAADAVPLLVLLR